MFCGPEGIRTLDLFNAIEARSQLRHRPVYACFARGLLPRCGDEGIRTPGLYSAIVALSQLSYIP